MFFTSIFCGSLFCGSAVHILEGLDSLLLRFLCALLECAGGGDGRLFFLTIACPGFDQH